MKNLKAVLLTFLICVFVSCNSPEPSPSNAKENKSISSENIDTLDIREPCIQKDTITRYGTKINYIQQYDQYKISWSGENFNRTHDTLYSCFDSENGVWDNVPKYYSENENNIVLKNVLYTSGGGNPTPIAYSIIVLPKNNIDSVFENKFFLDMIGNYIIYCTESECDIEILNLETKKSQCIILNPPPIINRVPNFAFQEIKMKGSYLYVKYEGYAEKTDDDGFINRKFKVKI